MEKFYRISKAFFIASALLLAFALAFAVAVWTKGLFILLLIFGALVFFVYSHLTYRADTVRKEDRKWWN